MFITVEDQEVQCFLNTNFRSPQTIGNLEYFLSNDIKTGRVAIGDKTFNKLSELIPTAKKTRDMFERTRLLIEGRKILRNRL